MQAYASLKNKFVPSNPYVFAVSSGKGGVGKTNIVINLAVEIQRRGLRVLVFDADLGLSNVPIFLGVSPKYDLSHVLLGDKKMRDVLVPGPEGISILPAGFGIQQLSGLTEEQQLKLLWETEELEEDFDVVLIDTSAGISSNVIFFNIVSHENAIVIYPEPAAISDAYVLMKILALQHRRKSFKIIINGLHDAEDAQGILNRLSFACQKFLGVSISYLGSIPYDTRISQAVLMQKPVVKMFPKAISSQSFSNLAGRVLASMPEDTPIGSLQFFWKRAFSLQPFESPSPLCP